MTPKVIQMGGCDASNSIQPRMGPNTHRDWCSNQYGSKYPQGLVFKCNCAEPTPDLSPMPFLSLFTSNLRKAKKPQKYPQKRLLHMYIKL